MSPAMLDIVVLFFLLGVFARLVKSDLRLPEPLYETLSIYLLLAIGLKGGIELSKQPMLDLLPQMLACLALGFAIPWVVTPVLRWLGLSRVDAASMAAHYGSVSVVTFAVASAYLVAQGVAVEPHAALWVALMEAPGIVAGIVLARLGAPAESGQPASAVNWRELAHDVFLGKSVLLLTGGLIIGTVMGEAGTAPIAPVFLVPFKGLLALFLLELGLVAGARLGELRRYGLRLVMFALLAPPVLALGGALTGWALGLSTGGVAIMATLAASASYIAAPTAMRMAVPEANAALSITAALGVTFPFNIVLGVPLYLAMARLFNA
jgi:uncharacterized protein